MKKIKVGIVNYLNTRPLLYGINRLPVREKVELIGDYPSNIAQALLRGDIDLGLVPVAIIPRMKEYHIIGDYCIGCDGEVASVCLFSEVPIDQVREVLLDYQSRTSVELARILLREYWKSSASVVSAASDYRDSIRDTTAGLVIGDRSFDQRVISPFVYDLGTAWKNHTGLPFVFAAWISNKQLDAEFIQEFNEANAFGLQHLDEVLEEIDYNKFDMKTYYEKNIVYRFDEQMQQGLRLFLSKTGNAVSAQVTG